MSSDQPKRATMSLEEATISNMWEIAALVELLERKGMWYETRPVQHHHRACRQVLHL
jgi:hypothetical protein